MEKPPKKGSGRIWIWVAALLSIALGLGIGFSKLRPTAGGDVVAINPDRAWITGGVLIALGVVFAVSSFFFRDRERP
jgi:hypothetical protein